MPDFKPGQTIRCTIERVPANKRGKDTILRLMRQDDGIRRGLRRAQKQRARATRVYIRGGRNWIVRPRAGKIARVDKGESWTMDYTPLLSGDLRSVESYLSVETV